jgi:hypothetical protein
MRTKPGISHGEPIKSGLYAIAWNSDEAVAIALLTKNGTYC